MHFKSGGPYWRLIIKFDRIDMCSIMNGAKMIPAVNMFIDETLSRFPSMPKKCPYMPGKYYSNITLKDYRDDPTINMTADEIKEYKKTQNKLSFDLVTSALSPNGIYRSFIKVFNEDDANIFTISYQEDYYIRLNDENF